MSNKIILAVETSRKSSSLALFKDGDIKTSNLGVDKEQGSDLLPQLKQFLNECNLEASEITDIALNVGPGASTGLRMGIAMAQGFAIVYPEVKIHAISLEAIATSYLNQYKDDQNQEAKALLVADAYAGSLFVQEYVYQNEWQEKDSIKLIERDQINEYDGEYYIVPDLGKLREKLSWPKAWTFLENEIPTAALVLDVALKTDKFLTEISKVDVRYLKVSSAELNWQKNQANNKG